MCPNGIHRSEVELAQFEQHFSCIRPIVEDFMRTKGMKIEKYDRGVPNWILQFARKQGGFATVTIGLDERTNADFYVTSSWWVDEYETETRHAKWKRIGKYHYSEPLQKFSRLLEKAIQTIKSWRFSDLNHHDGPMEYWKKHWPTKEIFEQASYRDYPVLDI